MSRLKALTHPRILIPILLSVALLIFVFSISDAAKVAGDIRRIPIYTMVLTFVLAVAYLALKGILWHLLMERLCIYTSWRQLVLAYAVGEMTLTVTGGIYAQNYVLRRIAGADFSRSSAATTAVLATEGAVSLLVLVILGIPGWDWLRPAILGLFGAAAVVVTVLIQVEPVRRLAGRLVQIGPLHGVGPEFIEMVEGLRSLFTVRIAARAVVLTTVYLVTLVSAFFLVTRAVGVLGFVFRQAVTVYLFALAVVLLSPVSTQLGITEASGLGAMQAWGYSSTEALAALLGFRLVWTGSIWLACGPMVFLLRGELAESGQ